MASIGDVTIYIPTCFDGVKMLATIDQVSVDYRPELSFFQRTFFISFNRQRIIYVKL